MPVLFLAQCYKQRMWELDKYMLNERTQEFMN